MIIYSQILCIMMSVHKTHLFFFLAIKERHNVPEHFFLIFEYIYGVVCIKGISNGRHYHSLNSAVTDHRPLMIVTRVILQDTTVNTIALDIVTYLGCS